MLDLVHISICNYFNISEEEIFKKSRKRDIVLKRQIFHYLCYFLYKNKFSYQEIGNYFHEVTGNKFDRTTVHHSINTIKNLLSYDKELILTIHQLKTIIKNG